MKTFLIILIFFILQHCSKPKAVFICGDHACINKAEAQKYFDENLTLEVQIVENNKKDYVNLVELNLKENSNKNKQIIVKQNIEKKKEVKVLNNNEIKRIKRKIRKKKENKKNIKKNLKNIKNRKDSGINSNKKKDEIASKKKIPDINKKFKKKKNLVKQEVTVNKDRKEVVDICTIIKKCSIDEISKYLLKQGKSKNFPNITDRK